MFHGKSAQNEGLLTVDQMFVRATQELVNCGDMLEKKALVGSANACEPRK